MLELLSKFKINPISPEDDQLYRLLTKRLNDKDDLWSKTDEDFALHLYTLSTHGQLSLSELKEFFLATAGKPDQTEKLRICFNYQTAANLDLKDGQNEQDESFIDQAIKIAQDNDCSDSLALLEKLNAHTQKCILA